MSMGAAVRVTPQRNRGSPHPYIYSDKDNSRPCDGVLQRSEAKNKPLAHNIFTRKEEDKPKRILVPVKGASADDEAMRLAYTYALAKKGKGRNMAVDVVYVVEVPHSLPLD